MPRLPCAAGGVLAALCASAGGFGFKPIYHGWDLGLATPEQVLARAEDLNRLPISGITLGLRNLKQSDGTSINAETIMSDPPWLRETADRVVPVYSRITAFPNLKNSFVLCSTQPRRHTGATKEECRFSWSDDAEWARIAENFRCLAYAARAGGLKGLLVDNEDYHGVGQFRYDAKADGDYGETVSRVRRRGREVFGAIFDEFPDITLFFFWAFIDNECAHVSPDPEKTLRESGRLTCAFLDGMLDVMPMTAVFVEGNENAYSYEAHRDDFARAAVETLSDMVKVVAPENRAKYRALVRNSYGLYLDEFTTGPMRVRGGKTVPNHWYRGARNGSRAEHFRENLESAAKSCDEYLWVYGEAFSAIDWGDGLDQSKWSLKFDQRTTWEDKIGLFSKIALVRGGADYAQGRVAAIRAAGGGRNLLPQTDFSLSADGSGAITKSFAFVDMTNRVPYVLDVMAKGDVRVAAYWLRDGMWCLDVPPEWFVEAKPVGTADANGWRQMFALVRGPVDVDSLSVQFAAKSGTCSFRDALFCRFETDAPSGRCSPEASGSAARVMACPELKKLLEEHPDYSRVDGDVVVIQKSVQFFEQAVETGRGLR